MEEGELPGVQRVLCIFAHPDDESYVIGGTIAKLASEGAMVTLVTAANGDKGQKGPHTPESMAALTRTRAAELHRACAVLGVSSLEMLGFGDGELAGVRKQLVASALSAMRRHRPEL